MNEKIILVLDCGATNVRTIAVNEFGKILESHSLSNNTCPDPDANNLLIWDVFEIWDKFKETTAAVLSKINLDDVAGVTVTAFGVDGAPFDKDGNMLYPVISWQCSRTEPIMNSIDKYISLDKLYEISGIQPFHFNTINKLIWFRENKPEILEKTDAYLFISSIFTYFLTGELNIDSSMAGTSMLTELKTRSFSDQILARIGVSKEIFPNCLEPGELVGSINQEAQKQTGIPSGTPVIASGHDTQFAVYGSGAGENTPVLSSGTWEILMVRARQADSNIVQLQKGVTNELDAIPGLYNIGLQWIASGMLEWVKRMFYAECEMKGNIYEYMISEALKILPGSGDISIKPDFFKKPGSVGGVISGLTMDTTRGQIYRAALESLSYRLKKELKELEKSSDFKAESLIVVGGGSRNSLWNQIRADVLNLPIKVIEQKETTVLGAALFALSGVGVYKSPEEARSVIEYKGELFEPGTNSSIYQDLKSR